MKKGLHPQMQWVSYVTQSGRLMHVMMTKIHHVGKVYHLKAKRQMAENLGQVAKFRQRYEKAALTQKEDLVQTKIYQVGLKEALRLLQNALKQRK